MYEKTGIRHGIEAYPEGAEGPAERSPHIMQCRYDYK